MIEVKNLLELKYVSASKRNQFLYYIDWKKEKRIINIKMYPYKIAKEKYYVSITDSTWIKINSYFSTKKETIDYVKKNMKKHWYKDTRNISEIWKAKNIIYDNETENITIENLNEVLDENKNELNSNEVKDIKKLIVRAKKKKLKDENIGKYKIWDVLVISWGYDQTNVNAYQIVELKNTKVVLKEIKLEVISSYWHQQDKVKPIVNSFLDDKKILKRIGTYGITINWYNLQLWDWERSYDRTWGY